MRAIKLIFGVFLVVYLGINALAYTNQRDMMYIPSTERVSPVNIGLHDVDEVVLPMGSDAELVSWFARPKEDRPTVMFFHGNAGAVSHRAYRFRELMAHGYGVFVLGYPGYGGNAGEPSEPSFHKAAQTAYDYLRTSGIDARDIVIYGESIGSGVAVQLAAGVSAKGLILEAPMSSAIDVAREHYPYLLVSFLLRDSYQSVEYIEKIDMPLLVMHGDKDVVIPVELGRKLIDRAIDPKKLVVIEGAGHNNLGQFSTSRIARDFIESL